MTLQEKIIAELGVKPSIDPKEEIRVSVDFLKDYCEVVYLPRTEGISTTQIKEDLNKKDMTAKGDK